MLEAETLLRRSEAPLLTLTGTGGVGKTRLGLQVVTDLQGDFADGVCFVSLAQVSDPLLVLPVIASALGLRDASESPSQERLSALLREQHLLLVLDNLDGGLSPWGPAAACPKLKMLVISRAILLLRGEYTLPVLTWPCQIRSTSSMKCALPLSMALFLERARAILPDFQITPDNTHALVEI